MHAAHTKNMTIVYVGRDYFGAKRRGGGGGWGEGRVVLCPNELFEDL